MSPLLTAKWQNVKYLITCFRLYDILAKTRSRMTAAIMFSRQMTLVHTQALFSFEKFSLPLSS